MAKYRNDGMHVLLTNKQCNILLTLQQNLLCNYCFMLPGPTMPHIAKTYAFVRRMIYRFPNTKPYLYDNSGKRLKNKNT